MKKREIGKITFDYYQAGFSCAEAIAQAIVEAFGEKPAADIPKVASAFCGGVGGTHEELCGALSGGIIAIGYLAGRMKPETDIQKAKKLATSLREQFIAQYGVTQCRAVLDKLGPQENSLKCKELTANVARMLARLLEQN